MILITHSYSASQLTPIALSNPFHSIPIFLDLLDLFMNWILLKMNVSDIMKSKHDCWINTNILALHNELLDDFL
jgi:hypothetical protein